ncbi:MAG: PqiC family protein [Woeseiaceae bacterium]|jgi:uncharacterized lipoprotein YmbA|nr:PqiC family protein [Woeseiaceae bacterium]
MMTKNYLIPALLAAIALSMTGCGTSPPSAYYTLDAADIEYSTDADGAIVLGIGPVRTPEYLERSQIVTRRDDAELKVDDFNRWAEPVADSLHRILAQNVDALLEDVVVISYPYGMFADYGYRLVGRVDRFDMDATGTTRLSLIWGISTPDGEIYVPPTRREYVESGGNPDDPNAVAAAMSRCLEQFSRDIAERFGKMAR